MRRILTTAQEKFMKIKILVKIGELILGKAFPDGEARADMYLPIWLLAFALLLLVGAVGSGIIAIVLLSPIAAAIAGGLLILGIAAILCWRNQTIRILSDECFEYTTFLGNHKVYRFADITGVKESSDSLTLILGKDKVHIESCALLTERLIVRINENLPR